MNELYDIPYSFRLVQVNFEYYHFPFCFQKLPIYSIFKYAVTLFVSNAVHYF